MSRIFLLVGIGGFIGSVVRYYFSHLINLNFPSSFPLGTFIVNLSGCLLIGIIFGFSEKGNLLSPEWRFFLATGFCGGFTTFSAFSLENLFLLREGEYFYVSLYTLASVVLGVVATLLGFLFTKLI